MPALEVLAAVVALCALSVLCAVGVLSPAYHDTLLQRIALAGICIGSLGVAWWCWTSQAVPGPVTVLALSACAFALETGRKLWARIRRGTWTQLS